MSQTWYNDGTIPRCVRCGVDLTYEMPAQCLRPSADTCARCSSVPGLFSRAEHHQHVVTSTVQQPFSHHYSSQQYSPQQTPFYPPPQHSHQRTTSFSSPSNKPSRQHLSQYPQQFLGPLNDQHSSSSPPPSHQNHPYSPQQVSCLPPPPAGPPPSSTGFHQRPSQVIPYFPPPPTAQAASPHNLRHVASDAQPPCSSFSQSAAGQATKGRDMISFAMTKGREVAKRKTTKKVFKTGLKIGAVCMLGAGAADLFDMDFGGSPGIADAGASADTTSSGGSTLVDDNSANTSTLSPTSAVDAGLMMQNAASFWAPGQACTSMRIG